MTQAIVGTRIGKLSNRSGGFFWEARHMDESFHTYGSMEVVCCYRGGHTVGVRWRTIHVGVGALSWDVHLGDKV